MKIHFFCSLIFLFFSLSLFAIEEEIDLRLYEKSFISQHGEDGVLEKIFNLIGSKTKFYVELGGDGHFCSNTKYLREKYGWSGLILDSRHENLSLNLHRETITAENICEVFTEYKIPQEIDLLSLDLDRNDFYVWKSVATKYKPRLVVIEFNQCFNWYEDRVIEYSSTATWNGSEYTGSSILALFNLGRKLGYSLVYQETSGTNLFFIRDDIIKCTKIKFKDINDVQKLYTGKPKNLKDDVEKFVSSEEILASK